MTDLGQELLGAVERDFTADLRTDRMISKLGRRIDNGGTWSDAEAYAARLGELKSRALQSNITADRLPDGRMSRELAEEILTPTLTENYRLALEASAQVQESLNESAGLGLKAVRPELNTERIQGLVDRIGDSEDFEDVAWLLGDPVVNFTQAVADETLEENVEFHADAGLSPRIERIAEGNCCKWCAELEGEWDYDDRPSDIYRRHENCRCQVIYKPVKGQYSDAHTKKRFETERDARIDHAERLANREQAMYHRRIGVRGKEVIDQPTYNKLTKDFLRTGGEIRRGGEDEAYLKPSQGAAYFRGERLAIFRDDATVSEVLEEMYHDFQERKELFSEYPDDEVDVLREIDAARYVMSLEHRYKITEPEMEELRKNLQDNEEKLAELRRNRYED